ncbi:MAG: hypothetical protein QOJ56_3452 [Mycobacterium sp.]|nr:hypothetical protein [Mycobacterium sp.]
MAQSAVVVHAGGNLPAEVTSFVGRRRELTDATRALSRSRLVTLTGVGGVGKTRVAERVARDRRRAYPHGVWLVELAELSDPALLTETVLTALGVPGQHSGDALEALIDSLTSRHLLLVLDNCEHLLDEVAALSAALLRSCPDLQILATSRAPLRVVGEAVVSVPPMAVPDPERSGGVAGLFRYDAVALFTERALRDAGNVKVIRAFDGDTFCLRNRLRHQLRLSSAVRAAVDDQSIRRDETQAFDGDKPLARRKIARNRFRIIAGISDHAAQQCQHGIVRGLCRTQTVDERLIHGLGVHPAGQHGVGGAENGNPLEQVLPFARRKQQRPGTCGKPDGVDRTMLGGLIENEIGSVAPDGIFGGAMAGKVYTDHGPAGRLEFVDPAVSSPQ